MPNDTLRGFRVLDLASTPAGAFCAKLLADEGAEVVTVEPPSGNALRLAGPFAGKQPHIERSLVFWFLGLNKRSVVADTRSPEGKRLVRQLAAKADILVETFPSGEGAAAGLAYDQLAALNPGLVYVSLTPFGQTGPYARYKADGLVLDALAGTMFLRGQPGRPPLKMGGMVADAVGGIAAYAGALTALYHRLCTGEGQRVDVSHREAIYALAEIYTSYYIYMGVVIRRSFDQMFLLPGRIRCKDGYAVPFFYGEAGWENLCLFLGKPDLIEDPRFGTFEARVRNAEQLCALVEAELGGETRKDLAARAQEWRLPFGYVASIDEAVEDEGNTARQFIRAIKHPLYGRFRYPGPPARSSNTRSSPDTSPPVLGADTRRIIAEWPGSSR